MKYSWIVLCLVCSAGMAQTHRISFKAPVFYPEGVAYDEAGKRFFVGSVKTGTIATVNEAGIYTPFYTDSSLKSSYGMKVDKEQGKLWVCTGDATYSDYTNPATYKKQARLIGLDLKKGVVTNDIDLSSLYTGEHFANDLTLDNTGNIYITDSYSPVVYRVDGKGKASVLTESALFDAVDVGLNGIVWHQQGFLLVMNGSQGQLYKIDIAHPDQITTVKQPAFFSGGDGLLWDRDGNLVVVQNKGTHKIFKLQSKDNWQSCELVAATAATDRFLQPSTSTLKDGTVYVLNSKLNELSDPTAKPSEEFSIQQAVFRAVK